MKSSLVDQVESLTTSLTNAIWTSDEIYEEHKFIKQPWHFGDARLMSKELEDCQFKLQYSRFKFSSS